MEGKCCLLGTATRILLRCIDLEHVLFKDIYMLFPSNRVFLRKVYIKNKVSAVQM